jgi:hypothetical protein
MKTVTQFETSTYRSGIGFLLLVGIKAAQYSPYDTNIIYQESEFPYLSNP